MHNIISTKTTSSIFLAALLALGTIATILPSAQAQSYYENTYELEYPSYKPHYKVKYSSDNNNNYKSKDSSVSINKLKCINNNLNINGNNTGDINVGKKGKGYLGADSYSGFYAGYGNNKQGKKTLIV